MGGKGIVLCRIPASHDDLSGDSLIHGTLIKGSLKTKE